MEGWEGSDAVPPPRDGTAWALRQSLEWLRALQDVLAHTLIWGEETVCVYRSSGNFRRHKVFVHAVAYENSMREFFHHSIEVYALLR